MQVEFTLLDIDRYTTKDSLNRITLLQQKSLPAKLRYWFNKGIEILIKEKNNLEKVKLNVFEQYGEKDNEGNLIKIDLGEGAFRPQLTDENLKKVEEELLSLYQTQTVDFGFRKLVMDSNKLPNVNGFEMELLQKFYIDSDDVEKTNEPSG